MQNFNYFKVNPIILTNQISEYIKNSIETNRDALSNLENEFKKELFIIKNKTDNVDNIP